MSEVYLILHGTGGNTPNHWQEHAARRLEETGRLVLYPKMPNPDYPRLESWLETLQTTLAAVPPGADLTVLAHSRGCILWLHHAALCAETPSGPKAERVLLVAPPYVTADDLEAQEAFFPGAEDFFPAPLSQEGVQAAARETVIIASDDDEYATFDQAAEYADALQVPIYKLSGAGHISPTFGYGPWPWVEAWAQHQALLPPQPNK